MTLVSTVETNNGLNSTQSVDVVNIIYTNIAATESQRKTQYIKCQ